MADSSRINRTLGLSELGNIRDEPNEDDDEFFAGAADGDSDEEEEVEEEEPNDEENAGDGGFGEGKQTKRGSSSAMVARRSGDEPRSRHVLGPSNMDNSSSGADPTLGHPTMTTTTTSGSSSRRFPSNLSKISEVPDEQPSASLVGTSSTFGSFRQGQNALQRLNEDQEQWFKQNWLRLPEGSFQFDDHSHASEMSWEKSALKNHPLMNDSQSSSISRAQLDLSMLQIKQRGSDRSKVEQKQHEKSSTNYSRTSRSLFGEQQQQQDGQERNTNTSGTHQALPPPSPSLSSTSRRSRLRDQTQQHSSSTTSSTSGTAAPFLSGNRFAIYFGFRRLGGHDSEECLVLHNVHPERVRVRVRYWLKGSKNNCFRIVDERQPEKPPSSSQQQQQQLILGSNCSHRVLISFQPPAIDHFQNWLIVRCESREATQKFQFLVHGFGGRALLRPSLPDRSGALLLSTSGRYQLLVNSLDRFHFALQNTGNRSAFASVFIYGRGGQLLPHSEAIVNTRNVIVDKSGEEDTTRVIEVRCLVKPMMPRPAGSNQLAPSTSAATSGRPSSSAAAAGRDEQQQLPPLQIVIFWGEERQRQRLRQFERKLGAQLLTFGRNFTSMTFHGEAEHWRQPEGRNVEKHVSEEEFYYFDANTRLMLIDILERRPPGERAISSAAAVGQQRTGSALSVASSGAANSRRTAGGTMLPWNRTIVEMDPDNTLMAAERMPLDDGEGEDTLTLL